MTYTYENALAILQAYKHLISSYSETEALITDICIAPADAERLGKFLEHYKQLSAAESLQRSGYDSQQVRIVVIIEQTLSKPGQMLDLEEYLQQKGVKYSFDPVTRSFVTLN